MSFHLPKFQGRLFMVVWFSLVTGMGWLYLLGTMDDGEARGAVFGTMFGMVTMIANSYFNRNDRPPNMEAK